MPLEQFEKTLASKLKSLSKVEQRQFLSLHNNFPDKCTFGGITKTNALPCGSESPVGGVYPTISLINHSSFPNSHNNWNEAKGQETIHNPSYPTGRRDHYRQQYRWPFRKAKAPRKRRSTSEACLRDCYKLFELLRQEYSGSAGILVARLCYDAFQITVAHADQARASMFAERAYEARTAYEGGDSPLAERMEKLMRNPTSHASYGSCSTRWKTRKEVIPKDVDVLEFDKWLWRRADF
ncbi:hypothetical protein K431DRAFT_144982 [Polychaeton citri CBS 116435]|uniref:Uncharacterized protein n=1 Tax=Polychaeton citri CBS 116435 TaxID=1314669 RepID=A0A9P4QDL1_9PEZI|nr:hypothetical protein K431DRAFT_144982 [Polychaeton citri CBS 116435]